MCVVIATMVRPPWLGKTGVATQIKALNSKCLYTHCFGHGLNLAVADAIKSVKYISDSLETVREIAKLVKSVAPVKHEVG